MRGARRPSVGTKTLSSSDALGDGAIEERSLPAAGRLRYAPQDDGADGLDAWARMVGASPVGKREKVCVSAAKAELQRLKPLGIGTVYVVAKATTHKDFYVLAHTPEPRPTKIPTFSHIL